MAKTRLYLNNLLAESSNLDSISWDFISSDGSPAAVLIDDLIVNIYRGKFDDNTDGMTILENWITTNSPFRAMPARLENDEYGIVFDGFVDFKESRIGCDEAELKLTSTHESFLDKSRKFNLRSEISVDYPNIKRIVQKVYVDEPDYLTALLTTASLYSAAINATNSVIAFYNALSDVLSPAPSPNAPSSLAFATANLVLALFVLEQTFQAWIDYIYQEIRIVYASNVRTLLIAALEKQGLTLSSSLFDGVFNDLYLLWNHDDEGVKLWQTPDNNPIPDITLEELIAAINAMFNSKVRVKSTTCTIENRAFYLQNPAPFSIERMADGDQIRYNISELARSIKLEFANDAAEKNTFKIARNSKINVGFQLDSSDTDFTFGDAETISIPFARGRRKNGASRVETLLNGFIDFINSSILSFFGISFAPLPSRIGCLQVSGDWVGVPKLLLLNEDGTMKQEHDEYLNAEYLFDNFYYEFTPVGAFGKWTIVEGVAPQPLCINDVIFEALKDNNICTDSWGNTAIIEAHVYNEATNLHEFRYRVQDWKNPFSDTFENLTVPNITINKNYGN